MMTTMTILQTMMIMTVMLVMARRPATEVGGGPAGGRHGDDWHHTALAPHLPGQVAARAAPRQTGD